MSIKEKLINGDETPTIRIHESNESINENAMFNKKDVEYQLDDFKNNKNNLLLIVGFSGSGKTTLANHFAQTIKIQNSMSLTI